MQIATEVRRGYVKKPSSVALSHFRLKFEGIDEPKKTKPRDVEAETAIARSRWFGMMTKPVKRS